MRRIALAATLVAALAPLAGAGKHKPGASVTFAKSWDAAVAEARLLNVPIVVHSHGFHCGPCWGMHGAVLQNRKYIRFSGENTVEVISLSRLKEGVEAGDRKAATYKERGCDVEYMVEFPGLTVDDMYALASSQAASYNQSGRIPYRAIVDPYTLKEMQAFPGSTSAKSLMGAIAEHKAALEKEHGKGVSRKVLRNVQDASRAVLDELEKGDLVAALDANRKLGDLVARQPEAVQKLADEARERVLQRAGEKLDALAAADAAEAARELRPLVRALEDTDLAERAADLLAKKPES